MAMSRQLPALLDAAWSRAGNPPLCVALSGGPDSTVLLHALASVRGTQRSLRAVHVDHGLHPDSTSWARGCEQQCAVLGVDLEIIRVEVHKRGEGIEAAARAARYAALARAIRAGEWLVTAHHREDQAETVLLKLMRGAGPHGLGAMRERRALGKGQLWRPLLDTDRAMLEAYALATGLTAIDDPANRDPLLARSFLREDILPRLATHWPHAARTLAQAARMQQVQAAWIDRHARAAVRDMLAADGSLHADGWVSGDLAVRPRVLELWLHGQGLDAPGQAQREELERQIRTSAPDRVPCVCWPGVEIRLWRRHLHAMRPLPEIAAHWHAPWKGDELQLPVGRLYWESDGSIECAGKPRPELEVRLQVPGLRLRPYGDRHERRLCTLFQQAGVPPWQRRFCPLLYDANGILLAVADLWTTESGQHAFAEVGARPRWMRDNVIRAR